MDHALAAYLDIDHRYPTHPRAAEALYSMGQATLGSNRPERDAEAQRLLTNLVTQYRRSLWAPRALMMRAESEERQKLYRRDEELAGSVPAALISYRQVATEYGRSSQAESAWWKLGQIYTETKRYPLAAHAYVTLATRFPGTRLDAWFAAAELYEKRLDDRARAQAAYALVPVSSPRYRDAQKRARR